MSRKKGTINKNKVFISTFQRNMNKQNFLLLKGISTSIDLNYTSNKPAAPEKLINKIV